MNGKEFEQEVLRVARALWRRDPGAGPELIDGRERDGVFYEDDVVHLLEATTERSEDKARHDCKKLSRLASEVRRAHQDKVVKCWFVTLHEPTDRQRAVARSANYPIHAIGFKEFQGRLINALDYLSARSEHRFGSAHNPAMGDQGLRFVDIDVKERSGAQYWRAREVADGLTAGSRFTLTADYGAGKSMLLREVFGILKRFYLDGKTSKFPVHINLREHSGAQFPDEILERHARIIGFGSPSKLVRAWRAGYVTLLLDGFDEITSLGFQGRWTKLKELRYKSLVAVREMISQQPIGSGVIIAGREYYFDSFPELKSSLALPGSIDLTLNDFTDSQIVDLLKNLGVAGKGGAPAWLPKRPLFVATLALRGVFNGLTEVSELTIGEGWGLLIARICEREATISSELDAETVRRVLERVATFARKVDGPAALSRQNLVDSFTEVCGYVPDEQGLVLLERLPGLGVPVPGSETRSFVDPDFECALGVGDVCRYLVEPWGEHGPVGETVRPLTDVGIAVGIAALAGDLRAAHPGPALDRARGASCLTFDLMQLSKSHPLELASNISIRDIHISHFDVSGEWPDSVSIFFNDCIFDVIDLEPGSPLARSIRLQGCLVRGISGVHAQGDLPKHFMDERCVVEEFLDGAATNASILEAALPLPVKVLMVILRKLFMQAGSARRENAFYRGLDTNAQRYVDDILGLLISFDLASRDRRSGEPLLMPNRAETRRISSILSAPETSNDDLVRRVRSLA